MINKYFITLILFLLCLTSYSQQKDTIYGKVKIIREKVEFLSQKENPQLLYYDDSGKFWSGIHRVETSCGDHGEDVDYLYEFRFFR